MLGGRSSSGNKAHSALQTSPMEKCLVFFLLVLHAGASPCAHKKHTDLKEWRDRQSPQLVHWEPNKVCHNATTCYGKSFNSPSSLPPQLIPLLTQPNTRIQFRSSSASIEFFKVTEDAFRHCKFQGAAALLDTSDVQVSSGANYFVANDTATPWMRCSAGQRINITVLSFLCSPPTISPTPSTPVCSRKGKCLASPYGVTYQCFCCDGFIGAFCEQVDGCFSNSTICLNGGFCTDAPDISSSSSSFTCNCPEGFRGKRCEEEDRGACRRNQCMNGGQCVEDASASNGFKCRCAAGYEGQACERDTDECLSAPCMHQGRCVDGVNSFTCTCATGYSGRLCEVDERPCRPGVCQNGGTCAVNDEGDSECFCSIGFSGTDCSTEGIACLPNPCEHSTDCVAFSNNSYQCICQPKYYGSRCELKVNISTPSCDSSPCKGAGRCEELPKGYQCRCDDGVARLECTDNITSVTERILADGTQAPTSATPLYAFVVVGIVVIIVILVFIILLIFFLNRRKSPPPYEPFSVSGEMQMRNLEGKKKADSPSELFQNDSYPDETISFSTSTISSGVSSSRYGDDNTPVLKRKVKTSTET